MLGLLARAAASDGGRDLASAVTAVAESTWGPFVAGGVGLLVLGVAAVVVTSTVGRRPGAPPDPAVRDRARARRSTDGYETGVQDAAAMRFRSPDDVVDALAAVCLAPAVSRRSGGHLVVEMPATASSWSAKPARRPACLWETGFLEEGLRRFAAGRVRVRETACRACGAGACRFEVDGLAETREARSGERLS